MNDNGWLVLGNVVVLALSILAAVLLNNVWALLLPLAFHFHRSKP